MNVIDALSAFLALLIGLAALSLVVAKDSNAAAVITSFGDSVSNLIKSSAGRA